MGTNFNINVAKDFYLTYIKNRYFGKARFIEELISLQSSYGDKSIVGCELSIPRNYQKRTVQEVLNDLDYTLIEFSHSKTTDNGRYHITATNFKLF